MFRKLYWVTERVDSAGASRVEGVYTSIPELLRNGISCVDCEDRLRLTLAKLDSDKGPLGCWIEPKFDSLGERLSEFVETDEFTEEHCHMLVDALKRRTALAA